MRWIILLAMAALTLTACSGKPDSTHRRKLTAQQRDSTIATSRLPGAGTVGRALVIADSSAARAARLNRYDP